MDDISSLNDNEWIINGKVYDLTNFLKFHPGGSTILNMNRRRDCTELFETYHWLSSKTNYIDSLMKKYFIRNATKDEICPLYNWNDTKYKQMKLDLKQKVTHYFQKESYKANTFYTLSYLIMFILLIINLYFYVNGYWITNIFCAIFAWNFSGDMVHSGLHYSIFSNNFYNELVGYIFGWYHCNTAIWFFQHTISHHSYTNIDEYDADLIWHQEIWFDQPENYPKPSNSYIKKILKHKVSTNNNFLFKMILIAPFTSLFPILSIIDIFEWNISHWVYLKWRFMKSIMIMTYIQTFIAVLFIPYLLITYFKMGIIKGLLFWIIPRFIHGYIYHIFSQVNHINKFSFQNNELQKSKNFIIHQIMSSCDYEVQSLFIDFISCGLNNQVLHHLFPSVHHCHYPYLTKILEQFCNQYGIKQSVHNTLTDAVHCYMDYLYDINVKH